MDKIEYKIMDIGSIDEQCDRWKSDGEEIVFTNGVFDLLHRGHIDYLSKAADMGDRLVIGLNSDASVRRLDKGSSRPLKDEYSRALILASLFFTDAVVLFSEPTPESLIRLITPRILVKGGDYDSREENRDKPAYIVGSDYVKKRGGRVEVIPFLPGYSTTAIEEKILKFGRID